MLSDEYIEIAGYTNRHGFEEWKDLLPEVAELEAEKKKLESNLGAFELRTIDLAQRVATKASQNAQLEAQVARLRSVEHLRPLMKAAANTDKCSGYGLDSSDFDWEYFQEALDA